MMRLFFAKKLQFGQGLFPGKSFSLFSRFKTYFSFKELHDCQGNTFLLSSVPILPPGKLAVLLIKKLQGEAWLRDHVFWVTSAINNKTNRSDVPKEIVDHLRGMY